MRKVVVGMVIGVVLTWGVQAASQALNPDVSSFILRKTPSVVFVPEESEHLSRPRIQVLYDDRGAMTGVAYQNQYGQSYLYDSAGRYHGMIQPDVTPVSNR